MEQLCPTLPKEVQPPTPKSPPSSQEPSTTFLALLACMSTDTNLLRLAEIVGIEGTFNLLFHLGGNRIAIPPSDLLERAKIATEAVLAVQQGKMTVPRACREHKVPTKLIEHGVDAATQFLSDKRTRRKKASARYQQKVFPKAVRRH